MDNNFNQATWKKATTHTSSNLLIWACFCGLMPRSYADEQMLNFDAPLLNHGIDCFKHHPLGITSTTHHLESRSDNRGCVHELLKIYGSRGPGEVPSRFLWSRLEWKFFGNQPCTAHGMQEDLVDLTTLTTNRMHVYAEAWQASLWSWRAWIDDWWGLCFDYLLALFSITIPSQQVPKFPARLLDLPCKHSISRLKYSTKDLSWKLNLPICVIQVASLFPC